MNESISRVKCPLCEGRGELPPSAIVEQFSNPELLRRLEDRIAEIGESLVSAGTTREVVNFHKAVHTWNPALPIWRRSPKE